MIKFSLRYFDKSDQLLRKSDVETKKRVVQIAEIVRVKAVDSLNVSAPTGDDGQLVGSTPPKPPHTRTGALKNSVQYELKNEGFTAIIGPSISYGKVHEFGGRNHPARPFMRPALRSVRFKFPELFRGLI